MAYRWQEKDLEREKEGETKEKADKLWMKCCFRYRMNNPKGIQSVCIPVYASVHEKDEKTEKTESLYL